MRERRPVASVLERRACGAHVRAGEETNAAHGERDAGAGERGLQRHELRVRSHQDRDFGRRHAVRGQRPDRRHDRGQLAVRIGVRHQLRLGSVSTSGAELSTGNQPVGERQHLRRAAVVLAEANDAGIGVSVREGGQVVAAGTGEAVDRLIRVADHAQVAPIAKPQPQQVLLEQVRVLVLVDAEPRVALAHQADRLLVALVELDGQRQHVLEVDPVAPHLGRLVSAPQIDEHVLRDGRLALRRVALRALAANLGPLDLIGEVLRRRELVATRQLSRERNQDRELGVQDLGQVLSVDEGPVVGQLAPGGGMEGRCLHLREAERVEAVAHLGRGLLGEGHDQRSLRVESARCDGVCGSMADDARLAGSGAGQDDDRPGRRLGRLALLVVEGGQDGVGIHWLDGTGHGLSGRYDSSGAGNRTPRSA